MLLNLGTCERILTGFANCRALALAQGDAAHQAQRCGVVLADPLQHHHCGSCHHRSSRCPPGPNKCQHLKAL